MTVAVLIAATVGLIASIVLSCEALVLAANANAVLDCDLNAVISCAAVANHWSASLLGFPNSFLGIAAMPVVMTIAVLLLARVKLPKWFMQAAQIGVIGGLLFAIWMFYMSYAVIGILCPWCLTVDAAMIIIFFGITRYNIKQGHLPLSKQATIKLRKFVKQDFDVLVMVLMMVMMVMAIVLKFGSELFA